MNTDRWLVTGGTGFIGREVVRLALQSGIRVAALTRDRSKDSLPQEVTAIAGDLASPDWRSIRAFGPQVCIHCAWIATPGEYLNSPENGTLAEDSIRFASGLYQIGLSRFVGVGTCLEYAPSARALNEEDARSTDVHPYVAAKLRTLDGIAALAPDEERFSWARIFYPYGPGEPPEKFPSLALRTLSEDRELVLRRPEDVVDYIHVADVASALRAVALAREGGIFNIGSGSPLRVREVAEVAQHACGGKGKIVEIAQSAQVCLVADTGRLNALGWAPSRTLEEGLRSIFHPAPSL